MSGPLLRRLRDRHSVWIAVTSLVAICLCLLPLLSLLAYPFVLVMAAVTALGAAHLGSFTVAQAREGMLGASIGTPTSALLTLMRRATTRGLSLLVLPLVIVLLNGLRVRNCDPLTGLAFYAAMPAVGVILASATGVFWALLVPRRALATLCALLTVAAFWIWAAASLYWSPAIFAFDPFIGYFPGAIYDEDVAVRAPLLLYRLYNLLWLVLIGSLAALLFDPATVRLRLARLRWSAPHLVVALAVFAAVGTMSVGSNQLGFTTDSAFIGRELGGVRRTAHFDIYHPASMTDDQVDLLAEDHEFHYTQLAASLKVKPVRLRSYVFKSAEQKRRLMGAANTYVAKPWRGEVYLQRERFPHSVLRHELVHLLAATFGDGLLGVSARWRSGSGMPLPSPHINFGLIEGLAVAMDWPAAGEATIHERAAALVRLHLAPPLSSLFELGFFAYSSGRAYTLAGSFCRYLIDTRGIERFKRLYRAAGAFEAVYGAQLAELAAQWQQFLGHVAVSQRERQLASEVFRRPSIFERPCPHTVARHRFAAYKHLSRNENALADVIFARLCSFDPGDPSHVLDRLEVQAADGRLESASALATKLLAHPFLTKPLERRVHVRIGDLLWMVGDLSDAASAYARAARLPASPSRRRLLALRQWGLGHANPTVHQTLRAYLVERDLRPEADGVKDLHMIHKLTDALPRSSVGDYLLGLQLSNHGHCDDAIPPLRRALRHHRSLPNDDFVTAVALSLGRCQYLEGRLADAADTYATLAARPALPSGIQLVASSWAQRVRWRMSPR